MHASLSADSRNQTLDGLDETTWSTTPTLRLLEVTCRLSRTQLDALLNSPPASPRVLDRPAAVRYTAAQTFNTIVCSLLLSAGVAAFLLHIT